MTPKESIECLKRIEVLKCHAESCAVNSDCKSCVDSSKIAVDMAIDALEKQVAKKPVGISINEENMRVANCPRCGKFIVQCEHKYYHDAGDCGQKLDWSVEE